VWRATAIIASEYPRTAGNPAVGTGRVHGASGVSGTRLNILQKAMS
jgi:hypothetical protein